MSEFDSLLGELDDRGYVFMRNALSKDETSRLIDALNDALADENDESILRSRGKVYGARRLLDTFPQVRELPKRRQLQRMLIAALGEQCGLVRGLFFDKPPDRSWSLPWHRDRTIAVADNRLPSSRFRNPTRKAGAAHVEAPDELLANMLTLRIHLDPMTSENGPLSVIPRSHQTPLHDSEEGGAEDAVELHASAGDVLAMRPLLSHSSSASEEATTMHRRILHLEFAPGAQLPDGFVWRRFVPVA